ncbi:MAG: hypothetical protein EX260_09810 [Desulfobulbaceae bacterium]|nr:MAG: hypothetical protein EX260_09810 [Desulfobulbaceae bacterium]
MGHLIRNCRFKFKCGAAWEHLDATEAPGVRYCGGCERDVHLCETDDELAKAIRENHCVAIPREGSEAAPRMAVGMMETEYRIDKPDSKR